MGQLQIKRIYDAPRPNDGFRILVDRLWPRGVSKDAAHLDLWMKDITPSPELRKWFCHDPALFAEFRTHYRAELSANTNAVAQIINLAQHHDITLLYAAKDPKINHAVILAEYLQEQEQEQQSQTQSIGISPLSSA